MKEFAAYVRKRREKLQEEDPRFSVRQVAARIKVQPSYLSRVERNQQSPPSEAKIRALAAELDEDPDVLLALAGKISSDLKAIIVKRPELFADLIRRLKNMPSKALDDLAREVKDGKW